VDRLEGMAALVSVAKAGGFSAAARDTGIPLATLSRRVADLEAELGVRLLRRSTRQIALTEMGQSYFQTCQRVLDEIRDAEGILKGEYRTPKGDLTLTAPMGFGRLHLHPVAMEFLRAYPAINLRLILADRLVDFVEEPIDLALRIAELADSDLIARPVGTIRMVVSASPEYLERYGAPTHPSDLAQHDCIAWSSLGPLNTWWFREANADCTFPIRTRFSTSSAESAIDAALSGLGLAQTTSYQAERGVREGGLVILLKDFECAPTPVSLVHAGNRSIPLKLRAFVDFAVPRLSERLKLTERAIARPGTPSGSV
jgi:DNA-binding transcriptional LysR family regulator